MPMPPPTQAPTQAPVVVSRIQNRRGTQSQFLGLYPPGYSGTGGVDLSLYPNVLMPGEIALCTDSRRIYMGNLQGEYIQLSDAAAGSELFLSPVLISLPPAASFTVIPSLTYLATPFTTIEYSATDAASSNWNTVGVNYSRNGTLVITAVSAVISNPVTLTDTNTEINNVSPNTINFIASYNTPKTSIQISYKHNFSTNIAFSTSAIQWLPF